MVAFGLVKNNVSLFLGMTLKGVIVKIVSKVLLPLSLFEATAYRVRSWGAEIGQGKSLLLKLPNNQHFLN